MIDIFVWSQKMQKDVFHDKYSIIFAKFHTKSRAMCNLLTDQQNLNEMSYWKSTSTALPMISSDHLPVVESSAFVTKQSEVLLSYGIS